MLTVKVNENVTILRGVHINRKTDFLIKRKPVNERSKKPVNQKSNKDLTKLRCAVRTAGGQLEKTYEIVLFYRFFPYYIYLIQTLLQKLLAD